MSFDLWVIHEFNKNFHLMLNEGGQGYGGGGGGRGGSRGGGGGRGGRGADGGEEGSVGKDRDAGSAWPTRPYVLLLTVSEKTDEAPYLYLSVHKEGGGGEEGDAGEDEDAECARVQAQLEDWIVTDDSVLDGVYLQFEESMIREGSPGRRTVGRLAERHCVGVWGRVNGADPDDERTAASLMGAGVSFVNTDLPRSFEVAKE